MAGWEPKYIDKNKTGLSVSFTAAADFVFKGRCVTAVNCPSHY